jgi:hypothetical protein
MASYCLIIFLVEKGWLPKNKNLAGIRLRGPGRPPDSGSFHGQLVPVGGLDVERESFVLDNKPTHLEGEAPPRLNECPIEEHDRLPQLKDRLPVIDCRADPVPNVLCKFFFHAYPI